MINKNISIWRGNTTPPTNYHLWEKEDGGLYVYLDEKWQHLVTPTDKTILDKIKHLALTEIDPIDTNTYKSYQLKSDDNIFGTTINIPKDRFIKQVTLGYDNATIDESTGIITIGTGLSKEYLLFSVVLESGSYELVSINLTNFLTEKDYSDGLEVVDNKLKVKVDTNSEEYLKVTNAGIKVEGINTKVSGTVEDIKTKIQNGDWISIKAGRDTDGNIKKGAISEGTNTTASAQQAHAEGFACNAKGVGSHAEGYNTNATEQGSHSEGRDTQSNALYAHAEGFKTLANGISSHAEGQYTTASGYCSHAEGYHTQASGSQAHAQGFFNFDSTFFIDMIGIGEFENEKNAEVTYIGSDPDDPKRGYKYLINVGGYQGRTIEEGMKSVQEVFADLENKVDKIDMTTITDGEIDEMFNK